MNFVKMHGAGNDYVYIECFSQQVEDAPALARRVSDRHKGVGSDGLVLIMPPSAEGKAHVRMRMFNSDGSEAQMCGNAVRCVGKYAFEHGLAGGKEMTVETLAGIKHLWLHEEDGRIERVTVDMGVPEWRPDRIPLNPDLARGESFLRQPLHVDGRAWEVSCVSMGNPHAVIFTSHVERLPLDVLGPQFENHPLFPQRTNTEFAEVCPVNDSAKGILFESTPNSPAMINMRVWERGAGETQACGTGACAVAVMAARLGLAARSAAVHVPGGRLDIEWRDDNHVYMTGGAEHVFEGRL